jgi:hypothetical protein
MCVSTPRRCLGNSACGFPVVSLEPAGHPVDSGAAESGCRARLAAPCEARTLRASLFLQVATGSLVGSAVVRNMVRTPCSLLGRPRARLVGTRALETAWRACQGNGLRRINYEVLGNSIPVLHGHIHARYDWEPPDKIGGPVWRCPKDVRNDPECAYSDAKHGELRAAITAELQGLIGQAY